MDGNVITGDIVVNGVGLDMAVLADAVWQGCKHMAQETTDKDTQPERRDYLLERIKLAATYHYIILGCSEQDAKAQAANYLLSITEK